MSLLSSAAREIDGHSGCILRLNAGGDIQGSVLDTVISTTHDEVVTPHTTQALAGTAKQVITTVNQKLCPLDPLEHDQTSNDPVVLQLVRAALSNLHTPLSPSYRPDCD